MHQVLTTKHSTMQCANRATPHCTLKAAMSTMCRAHRSSMCCKQQAALTLSPQRNTRECTCSNSNAECSHPGLIESICAFEGSSWTAFPASSRDLLEHCDADRS